MSEVPEEEGESKGAWEEIGSHSLQRNMVGAENFWYLNTVGGCPQWSIIPTVLVKVKDFIMPSMLAQVMRGAWRETLIRVPNLTFQGSTDEKQGHYHIQYNQEVNEEEIDLLLSNSFQDSFVSNEKVEIDKVLADLVTNMSEIGCEKLLKCHFLLHIVYFYTGSTVTHFGLVGFADHAFFDGTGAYLCLGTFLEIAVNQIETAGRKPEPEKTFWQYLPLEVRNKDHSGVQEKVAATFTPPNSDHSIVPAIPQQDPHTKVVKMYDARRRFSKEETTLLLQRTKKLGLTITHLASACSLIPLLEKFPASETSTLVFFIPFNMRADASLPIPYYGNAMAGISINLPCSLFSENLRRGKFESREDAVAIIKVATFLKSCFQDYKQDINILDRCAAFSNWNDSSVKKAKAEMKKVKKLPSNHMGIVSDGLLERNIKPNYTGDRLSLTVLDVHLISHEPRPSLSPRISTFDGRLSLNYAFNDLVWEMENVQVVLQKWSAALYHALAITSE